MFFFTFLSKTISKEEKVKFKMPEQPHSKLLVSIQALFPPFFVSLSFLLHPLFGFTPLPRPASLPPTLLRAALHPSEEEEEM